MATSSITNRFARDYSRQYNAFREDYAPKHEPVRIQRFGCSEAVTTELSVGTPSRCRNSVREKNLYYVRPGD